MDNCGSSVCNIGPSRVDETYGAILLTKIDSEEERKEEKIAIRSWDSEMVMKDNSRVMSNVKKE